MNTIRIIYKHCYAKLSIKWLNVFLENLIPNLQISNIAGFKLFFEREIFVQIKEKNILISKL